MPKKKKKKKNKKKVRKKSLKKRKNKRIAKKKFKRNYRKTKYKTRTKEKDTGEKIYKTKRFVAVQVRFEKKLKNPVSLENIRKTKELKDLLLIKQSRLSVMPINTKHWKIILNMSKIA